MITNFKKPLTFLAIFLTIDYANGSIYENKFEYPTGFPDSGYSVSALTKPSYPYYPHLQKVPKYEVPLPGLYHPSSDKVTVHRHVFVHVAPDDEPFQETRVIRPEIPKHQHVNIIFVKAPNQHKNQLTEVLLPEQPPQKTVVYVLVKKREEPEERIKVRGPEPTQPPKPEVFFIRYKSHEGGIDNDKPGYSVHPSSIGVDTHHHVHDS